MPPGSRDAHAPGQRPAGPSPRTPFPVSGPYEQLNSLTITVVRYALKGSFPLPLTAAHTVAHLARQAAMAWYGRLHDGALSPTLAGKTDQGVPLSDHRHAHYLVTDEDHDGNLDRVTVWAPAGLTAEELAGLSRIDGLRAVGRTQTLQLFLLGWGRESDLPYSLSGPARHWRSWTPFVPARHPHRRGEKGSLQITDAPADQVRLELAWRGVSTEGVQVEEAAPEPPWHPSGQIESWMDFGRVRPGHRPPATGAFGFVVSFPEPVAGPLALGYGSHFSLGLFTPCVNR